MNCLCGQCQARTSVVCPFHKINAALTTIEEQLTMLRSMTKQMLEDTRAARDRIEAHYAWAANEALQRKEKEPTP